MPLAGRILSGDTRFAAIHSSILAAAVNAVRQPDFRPANQP